MRSAEAAPYSLPRLRLKMRSIVREIRLVDREFEMVTEKLGILKTQFDKVRNVYLES